jgi:hypothetical protein
MKFKVGSNTGFGLAELPFTPLSKFIKKEEWLRTEIIRKGV